MKDTVSKLLLMLVLIVCIASCTSRINKANFDRIAPGMSLKDVIAILGKPTSSTNITIGNTSGTSARWANRNGSLSILFFNGKVKIKQFVEGVLTPREG